MFGERRVQHDAKQWKISNAQGDRTVGITETPTPEFLDRLKDIFGFEPPGFQFTSSAVRLDERSESCTRGRGLNDARPTDPVASPVRIRYRVPLSAARFHGRARLVYSRTRG